MFDRSGHSFLRIIMIGAIAIFVVPVVILFLFYHDTLEQKREHLYSEIMTSAHFLESVIHFDAVHQPRNNLGVEEVFMLSIKQFTDVIEVFAEEDDLFFSIVEQRNDGIQIVYHHCQDQNLFNRFFSSGQVDALFFKAAAEQEGFYEGDMRCIDGSQKRIISFFTSVEKNADQKITLIGSINADAIRDRFFKWTLYLALLSLFVALVAIVLIRRQLKVIETTMDDQIIRYDLLFELTPIPLVFVDKNRQLSKRNRRFTEIFGYTYSDVPDAQTWFERAYPDPEYREKVVSGWYAEVSRAAVTNSDIAPHEYNVTCKDGSVRPMLISGVPIGEEFIITFIDMSSIRSHESALKMVLDFNKQILDTLASILVVLDHAGQVLLVNQKAAEILGYDIDQIVGKSWFENFLPAENVSEVRHYFERTVQGIKTLDEYFENEVLCASGETRMIAWHNAVIYNASGGLEKVICSGEDITERETLRSELIRNREIMLMQSRNAAMGEMIGMIAHQWRQPLATIAMSANTLQADVALENVNPESIATMSDTILEQAQYLSHTIDDFRNFFRPKKEIERLKMMELFEELVAIVGKSLEHDNIDVEISCDPAMEVTLYARELLQVLINIVKNAKEAILASNVAKGRIVMHAEMEHGRLMITACDNGGGIKKDVMIRMFDPYFTTKDESIGTGLGLYMCKMIVEKHLKGEIQGRNTGSGACFILKIPQGARV